MLDLSAKFILTLFKSWVSSIKVPIFGFHLMISTIRNFSISLVSATVVCISLIACSTQESGVNEIKVVPSGAESPISNKTPVTPSSLPQTSEIDESIYFSPDDSKALPCLEKKIYKGIVGKILEVAPAKKDKDGLRYDFEYRYPNSFVGSNYTVLKEPISIKTGDHYLWVPANRKVRAMNPKEDRQVPLIVNQKTCKYIQVDWSSPALKIKGIQGKLIK
jgi:hypothetical protein